MINQVFTSGILAVFLVSCIFIPRFASELSGRKPLHDAAAHGDTVRLEEILNSGGAPVGYPRSAPYSDGSRSGGSNSFSCLTRRGHQRHEQTRNDSVNAGGEDWKSGLSQSALEKGRGYEAPGCEKSDRN
jgi:hypothetical protein